MCPPPTISSVPNATFGYEDKVFGREVFGRQEAHRSGQGWQGCKLPPRAASSSFWLFMLLPIRLFAFHASDTNGLMVAKPVTCLPNWLLHYGSPNKSSIANQIWIGSQQILWNICFHFFLFNFSDLWVRVSVCKSEVLNFDHVPTFPINVCPSPNADSDLPMPLSSDNRTIEYKENYLY